MRGFASRTTVTAALGWIDSNATPCPATRLSIEVATGRVLATDVHSEIDVPAFDRSAMDGFALRAEETTGAGPYNPLSFTIVGESLPGRPCPTPVTPGHAVRIMTGAPIPSGADAVLPAEYAQENDNRVEITTSIALGKHIGRTGEDVTAGSVVLEAGRRLRPQDVAVLASIGCSEVMVVGRPQVRVIITGEELALPGHPREPHQIYEANSFLLRGLIPRDGANLLALEHIPDHRDLLRAALTAPGADLILVSGGSSVGSEDFAPQIVAEEGALPIHGIAMRPSSPTGLGRIGSALVVLLPGNPVSCLCAYDFFAGRALRRMAGRPQDWSYQRSMEVLGRKITSQVGRTDYCRVRRTANGIVPVAISGASILSSTTRADGFVVVPDESEGMPAGSSVEVFWYDEVTGHPDR